jgi:hypothetical protein
MINRDQFYFGISIGENSEHFISEALADNVNILKVQYYRFEFFHPVKNPLGLGTRY